MSAERPPSAGPWFRRECNISMTCCVRMPAATGLQTGDAHGRKEQAFASQCGFRNEKEMRLLLFCMRMMRTSPVSRCALGVESTWPHLPWKERCPNPTRQPLVENASMEQAAKSKRKSSRTSIGWLAMKADVDIISWYLESPDAAPFMTSFGHIAIPISTAEASNSGSCNRCPS
jgi:hypothetical protein